MATQKVGLVESVSMAIGGMVGGGIFAVLGVVAVNAGALAWFAFIVAGVIALCAGYSFVRLNELVEGLTGPISFIERFTGSTKLGGMAGWTFIVGYMGTMAMYAYAFGGYFVELSGVHGALGVPLRPVVSVCVIAVFVGLNTLGAHASGRTEDLLVGLKVLILLAFGGVGIYYASAHGDLTTGLSSFGVRPIIATAISFVAFEGWELLMFDQDSIRDPKATVRKAIFVSIVFTTGLYILVAVVTTDLLPASVIQTNAETALAVAARPFFGEAGFVLISVAALFSTASAINATLFSSARLAKSLAAEDLLPQQVESGGEEPVRALLVLGVLTAVFSAVGTLDGVTSFASMAFILIFGAVSFLALRERGTSTRTWLVPAIGVVGSLATVLALFWHLYETDLHALGTVLVITVIVLAAEVFYFERESILAAI